MAERRMFSKTIIDSDEFLDMPLSSQALYFHLSMRADDEGFINNHKKIQRMIGASDDDMKVLIAKGFILLFESGIIVVKHWRIHNYIRADRLVKTNYQEERSLLDIKANGAYTLNKDLKNIPMSDKCQSNVSQMSVTCPSNVSIGKDSIGKDSIGKVNKRGGTFVPPTHEEIKTYCDEKGIKIDIDNFLDYYTSNGWMVGKNKMKSWQCTVNRWARMDKKKDEPQKDKFNNFESSQGTDWDEVERRLLDKK